MGVQGGGGLYFAALIFKPIDSFHCNLIGTFLHFYPPSPLQSEMIVGLPVKQFIHTAVHTLSQLILSRPDEPHHAKNTVPKGLRLTVSCMGHYCNERKISRSIGTNSVQ